MMNRCYCYACDNFFTADDLDMCPICNAVGDDLEMCDDEIDEDGFDTYEPTEEDIEAMYQESLARDEVIYKMFIIGAQ